MSAYGTSRRKLTAGVRSASLRAPDSAGEARCFGVVPEADLRRCEGQLFDHLVGAGEERWRHNEAERSGGLEVDDKLEPRRLLDRQIRWPGTL
jgi:hypothetical protein